MSLELFPGKHLFLDDFRIEELSAARRVLNPPVKHPGNPVLGPREPWEETGLHLGRLLYDNGRGLFRLWYSSQAATVIGTRVLVKDNPPSKVRESHICCAESADAVHWERPAAGVTGQDRYPGNNIVVPSLRPPGRAFLSTLIDDPFESDPARRFKMMYLDQAAEGEVGGGLAPDARLRLHAHSPDGIHWTRYPWQPHHVARLFGVLAYLDEAPSGRLDPDARYILYGQRGSPWKTRQIGRRDSGDFLEWSGNRPVLESRLADDPPGLEFYHMEGAGVNQTYAGLHLGMLGAYHTDLRRKYDPARNDGLTECQLAWSRDSVRWERWDAPFIARGEHGAFDWGGVYCGYPAIAGDTLCFMYTGESGRHGRESRPTLGLATLRLDGFASVETSGFMQGTLVTRPHHWDAGEVAVNLQSEQGGVTVQLQDETGRAFEGFGEGDCDAVREDAVDRVVTWGGGADVRSLEGKMVALKFTISPGDRLFSYTLKPSGAA